MERVRDYKLMKIPISVKDFSGGINKNSPERLSLTESSELKNIIHVEGALRSINGRTLYNQDPILAATPVKSLYRWYKTGHRVNDTAATTKKGWTVARCGAWVWLACEVRCTATATPGGNYIEIGAANTKLMPSSGTLLVEASEPYRLAYTAKNETTGRLTCVVPANWVNGYVRMVDFRPIYQTASDTTRCDFESMNGRLYFTAARKLMRFDGFHYAVGTLSAEALSDVVTGTNTDWTHVRPGDKLFVKSNGTWGNMREVKSVDSATQITLTAGVSSYNGCDYIIARVNNAGIRPPVSQPTLAESAGISGTLGTGVYKYLFTLKNVDGEETTAGSPQATVTTTTAGQYVFVEITPQINWTYSGEDPDNFPVAVVIYRTEVGGSAFKKLTELEWNGNSSPNIAFLDATADGDLGALFTGRTTGAGVPLPYVAPSLTLQGGTSSALGAGTYRYSWTLYNSLTDTESNPSPEASIYIPANRYIDVTLTMTESDRQADYVRLYRTQANKIIPKLVAEIPWNAGDTSISYSDNVVSDVKLGENLIHDDHEPAPSSVTNISVFNGRIYAHGENEVLYFSTLGDPEHWPQYEYGVNEPTFVDPTLGGYVRVGSPGDVITSTIVDAGSYATSGTTGACMLVQTKTKAWMWWGKDWTDHRLDEAWTEGCTSGLSAANCAGILAWLTRNGPVLKPTGSPLPERAYFKLFPPLRRPFADQVSEGFGVIDRFIESSAVYWREYYIFTYVSRSSNIPDRVVMLHLPTGTFTEIGTSNAPCYVNQFCVFDGPGDNGELYYADADGSGYVWRLFAKSGDKTYWNPITKAGVEVQHKTGLIEIAGRNERAYTHKHATGVTLCFDSPVTQQTFTPKVYIDGLDSSPWTGDAQTLGAASSGRAYIRIPPEKLSKDGRGFQLEWTGTFTSPVTLQGYVFEYDDSHGK
jgi:hypothetical protein